MSNSLGWWALVNVLYGGFMAAAGAGVPGFTVYGVSWVLWYHFVSSNDVEPGAPA